MNMSWKAVAVAAGLLGAITVPCASAGDRPDWCAGTWDASIYNLMDHPRTIAVRIEVVDAETRLPVGGVDVRVTGTWTEERVGRSGDEVGIPREPQKREFRLMATTRKDGVAVFALGWQKEYPWRSYFGGHAPRDYKKGKSGSYTIKQAWTRAVDDVEKAQKIEIRHPRYRYAEMELGFTRFLNVGQDKKSAMQRPVVFDKFEEAWHAEVKRENVRFCVLDLGRKFPDYGNKKSNHREFFEKIRRKDYGKVYTKPLNWFSKGDYPQSLCGPYFVYLVEIRLERRSTTIEITPRGRTTDEPDAGRSGRLRAGNREITEAGEFSSWRDAVNTIKRSLSSDMAVFDADCDEDETELSWQIKSENYTDYQVRLSPDADVGVFVSGATVTISCPDAATAEDVILVIPRNSRGQLQDDTHPLSVMMSADSAEAAREMARALKYLMTRAKSSSGGEGEHRRTREAVRIAARQAHRGTDSDRSAASSRPKRPAGAIRGLLRLSGRTLTPEVRESMRLPLGTKGVLVDYVEPESPAAKAGIKTGTVIESVSYRLVFNLGALETNLAGKSAGDQVIIGFWKRGKDNCWEREYAVIRLSDIKATRTNSDKHNIATRTTTYNEGRVRYILADIQIGGVADYYRRHRSPEDKEAIRRWDSGLRVTNISRFERVIVPGKGWQIVYKGTTQTVNPEDIKLTAFRPTIRCHTAGGKDLINVALQSNGASATADSIGRYLNYVGTPDRAINGDKTEGWRGTNIPGWIKVEFDKMYIIHEVGLVVGSHRHTYIISLSENGKRWTEVVPPHQSRNSEGNTGHWEIYTITPVKARYMKVEITKTSAPFSHIFQASINELLAKGTAAR